MKLAQIFRDGLILQRNKPIRVFGEGVGNVTVRLELESGGDVQYRTAKADEKDSWLVELDARPAGGPYIMTVTCGLESITLRSIMIGTLLLFTGQSNNAMTMAEEVTPESEYVRDALLRIYFPDRILKNEGSNINAGWMSAFPNGSVHGRHWLTCWDLNTAGQNPIPPWDLWSVLRAHPAYSRGWTKRFSGVTTKRLHITIIPRNGTSCSTARVCSITICSNR